MEPIMNTKRKKRKTRKCLNEIRKKSLRTGHLFFEKEKDNISDLIPNYNKCIITKERLSLRTFPKTVRSETITRPVLAELKQKPNLKLDELRSGSKVLDTLNSTVVKLSNFSRSLKNTNDHIERYKVENPMSLICSMGSNKYDEDSYVINMCNQEDKFNNTNVCSFIDPDQRSNKSSSSIGVHSGPSPTSTSNHRFHDSFRYDLYEEFISEIPKYLKQTVKTMEGDIVKNTKVVLKQLFISECCYQEKYYTPKKVIVRNPMDYIRLSHVQQRSLFHQSSRSRRTFDEIDSFPPSPIVISSSPSISHHFASSPDSPLNVIVNNTPDYSFYPHRLN
ncbi:unnamed protein product [Spodoptera littoralis]|uniref:Uncharacterized protein n=1 Tax=Spodoptera littoralis TaxID=7109 RepID=A0A9P0HWF6_SPOLI|nr:unnamed protein product [Spodoptera littoralis]CAH1635443.1 unnamed protein product [Spodoptera littoralis]